MYISLIYYICTYLSSGVKPNPEVYMSLLEVTARDPSAGDEGSDVAQAILSILHDTNAYGALIRGEENARVPTHTHNNKHARRGRASGRELEGEEFERDLRLYNLILACVCNGSAGDLRIERARKVLDYMYVDHVEPNDYTLDLVDKAYEE